MNQWLPFVGSIGINLLMLAFFFGKYSADMAFMKGQLASLMVGQREGDKSDGALEVHLREFATVKGMTDCHHTRIAVLERRMSEADGKFQWGTERINEVFRWLSSIAKGDIPGRLPLPPAAE